MVVPAGDEMATCSLIALLAASLQIRKPETGGTSWVAESGGCGISSGGY